MRHLATATSLVLILAAAGCGDDDSSTSASSNTTTAAAAPPSATTTVETTTVKPGATPAPATPLEPVEDPRTPAERKAEQAKQLKELQELSNQDQGSTGKPLPPVKLPPVTEPRNAQEAKIVATVEGMYADYAQIKVNAVCKVLSAGGVGRIPSIFSGVVPLQEVPCPTAIEGGARVDGKSFAKAKAQVEELEGKTAKVLVRFGNGLVPRRVKVIRERNQWRIDAARPIVR